MPIYEYVCPQCGHLFEEWTRGHDAAEEQACPQCGAPASRVMSQTSFVLKGGGWYVSDYGYRKGISEDGSAPAAQDKPADKPADSAGTADSAPAAAGKPAGNAPVPPPSPPAGASAGVSSGGTLAPAGGGSHD